MSINVKCFGGLAGWYLKKLFPKFSANAYIKINFLLRRAASKKYIESFYAKDSIPKPIIINIETINRCNSTCEFCPANRNSDQRPYALLEEEYFHKVISELKEWRYDGIINLYANNEPLLDKRIIGFYKYVKKELPNCTTKMFTNGMLLTKEKFMEIIPYLDMLVINNYGETPKMHKNVEEIFLCVKNDIENYKDKDIKINIRYIKDVLTNRAGEAPNKKGGEKIINEPCLFPFTDMTIFSNGNVGICCNDATEKTCLGNIKSETIRDIWELDHSGRMSFHKLRGLVKNGRNGYTICRCCDTVDSGTRVRMTKGTYSEE